VAWVTALQHAVTLRTVQDYPAPLLAGARVRPVMAGLCPLLAAPGCDAPATLRAIAAAVTRLHPAALVLRLAGADLERPVTPRARRTRAAAEAEAWLRAQLDTLDGGR
jgi:hypothetical protein